MIKIHQQQPQQVNLPGTPSVSDTCQSQHPQIMRGVETRESRIVKLKKNSESITHKRTIRGGS